MFLREPRKEFDCVNAVHREINLENQRRRPDSDRDWYAASSTATRSPSTSRRPCMYASPKPISGSRISRIRVPRSEKITLATGKASEGETSPPPLRIRQIGGRPIHRPCAAAIVRWKGMYLWQT